MTAQVYHSKNVASRIPPPCRNPHLHPAKIPIQVHVLAHRLLQPPFLWPWQTVLPQCVSAWNSTIKISFNLFAFPPYNSSFCIYLYFLYCTKTKPLPCTLKDPSEPHHKQQQSVPLSSLKAFAALSSVTPPPPNNKTLKTARLLVCQGHSFF